MTLPTPNSPSSNQPLTPDREYPDCPAIVPTSMPVAPQSAEEIDDRQWARIVVESLSGRSPQAREALLEALQNDQPARSVGSSSTMGKDWSIGEPEVSGDAAAAHDRTQASVETSTRTVPPSPPLGTNASSRASGKDHHNGQRAVRRGSMPLLAPFLQQRDIRRSGARMLRCSMALKPICRGISTVRRVCRATAERFVRYRVWGAGRRFRGDPCTKTAIRLIESLRTTSLLR